MKQRCITAVEAALGRKLAAPEAADIEARINAGMRHRARQDPAAWQALPESARWQIGAQEAAKALVAEARVGRERLAQEIAAKARVDAMAAARPAGDHFGHLDALLAFRYDGQGRQISIESSTRAISREAFGRVQEVYEVTRGDVVGLTLDRAGALALVREAFRQDSGVPEAKQAAQAWADTREALRQRFNRAGGNIGKLENYGLPTDYATARVAPRKAEFVADMLGFVDRSFYLHPDGTRFSDAEMTRFLEEAATTIATEGANKQTAGQFQGVGAVANRGSQSRQLHFKDAESWMAAQEKYGDRTVLQLITGHIQGMARDIAMIEALGPNPAAMLRLTLDEARHRAIADGVAVGKVNRQVRKVQNLYTEVSGTRPTASGAMADAFGIARDVAIASKLGSAALSSVVDYANMMMTARVNELPVTKMAAFELGQMKLSPDARRVARRGGLGVEQMIGTLHRFGSDGMGAAAETSGAIKNTTGKVAQTVMQLSGLNLVTAARRSSVMATLMDSLGEATRTAATLADLPAGMRGRMESAGITDADVRIWNLAKPENWESAAGGHTVLTAQSIYAIPDAQLAAALGTADPVALARAKDQAATRLMATVTDEGYMGVVEPGARERSLMRGGVDPTTFKGQVFDSAWLFKSYPVAVVMKHLGRGMAQPGWGKGAYLGPLLLATTVLGGLALQLGEIANGRDPLDMDDPTFWQRAAVKGGSLGLYGDFLLQDRSAMRGGVLNAAAGPIISSAADLYGLTVGNAHQALRGDETNAGAEAARFLKSNTPGANLWYTKAATDHMLFHHIQEAAAPGYLERMQRQGERDFGQSYFWTPGDNLPGRAPDLGRAFGGATP